MLQTIEVHIDTNGYIHPIEPIKKYLRVERS